MSWFALVAILLLVLTQSVLSQGTGAFTIGGQIYPSHNQQYDALYVYDQTRGSPAPFNFTCTSTQGTLLDVRTTNELISLQSLIGTRVVNNVTITGTSSSLNFDPEFIPQFSGIYKCAGDSVQEAVMITTENPFLRLNMGLVTVTGSADMFNITVMGAYTASGGVSLRPTLEDYSLVYFLGGEAVAVQDLVVVMDLNPYEQVLLVDVGQNVQNGTNFNLTLSASGLTTSVIFPVIVQFCPQEMDMGYGIAWDTTVPGGMSFQSCGAGYTGTVTRFCWRDARWAAPNVSQCENVAFAMLRITAEELYSVVTVVDDETLSAILDIVSNLTTLTQPTTLSIFPRDLNTSNYIITNTVDLLLLSLDQGGATDITASTEVFGVIDNLLNRVNLAGFGDLQAEVPAGQSVLKNAERYALYLATAMSLNASEQEILLSRGNIVVRSERITVTNGTQPTDVTFPQEDNLENFTISSGLSPAFITVPAQLLVERSNSSTVPVAHIQFQNLQDILPPELDNSTAVPVSLIISSQVAVQSGESMSSQILQENPVTITFTVEGETDKDFTCVFWNFSKPIGNGGWSTEGVTTEVRVSRDGNNTVVQCNSTHITSFAVLSVNVAGSRIVVNTLAQDIVIYVGLGISMTFLLLTIIFFLSLGKKLFREVHNFVHLNLAIALFVGYFAFGFGVRLATSNKAACQSVTAISQYFLMASFCWMLCEGIMAYLLLVLVFNSLSRKWWFFLILGWTPPIVFVTIGLTTALDGYVVYLRNDAGEILTDSAGNDIISFCWLSSGNGTNAIWIFIAPVLTTVLVNSVFLVLVLVSVYRHHRTRMSESELKEKGIHTKLAFTLAKVTITLLPLLGLTSVFEVLTTLVSRRYSLVFASFFAVSYSLQGVCIFFFHVLRSERVWGLIKKKWNIYSSTHRNTGKHGTASISDGKKTSRVNNKSNHTSNEPASVAVETTTVLTESLKGKTKSDPTLDQPTSDAVQNIAAEVVFTESEVLEEVGYSREEINLLVEVNEELLLRRNKKLRNRVESVLGVAPSTNTEEPMPVDILLCQLMNKLHPGMIQYIYVETSVEKRTHNVAEFVAACKKLKVPEHKLCTPEDIMEGNNLHSVMACLEYLLETNSL